MDVTQPFEERLQEIETYLDLLETLEHQVRDSRPRLGQVTITAQQQKILYSSVYLQLYNLVEATMTWCVDAVCAAASEGGRWHPGDLAVDIRREWVRSEARTHTDMTAERRLESAVAISDHLIQALPLLALRIERRGNVDDEVIHSLARRLGVKVSLTSEVQRGIKEPVRDEKGPLALVRHFRNSLAHGNLSFSECGDGVTVQELRQIKLRTVEYLREVILGFHTYIDGYHFLLPESRP